jgi:hypothetical protein
MEDYIMLTKFISGFFAGITLVFIAEAINLLLGIPVAVGFWSLWTVYIIFSMVRAYRSQQTTNKAMDDILKILPAEVTNDFTNKALATTALAAFAVSNKK